MRKRCVVACNDQLLATHLFILGMGLLMLGWIAFGG